jgi:hypothetical protein
MDWLRECDFLMAHCAEIVDGIVTRVIVVSNDYEPNVEQYATEWAGGGVWKQTSYNANLRGKYAGVGDFYNVDEDIFVEPQPFTSWIREGSFWKAPIDKPQDEKHYKWNEDLGAWVEAEII